MRAKLYWSTGLWFAASVWLSQHFCEWTFVQLKPVFRMRLVCGSWLRNGLGNFLGMGCLRMVCLRCQLSCWLVPDTNWLEYDLSRSPPPPTTTTTTTTKKQNKKKTSGSTERLFTIHCVVALHNITLHCVVTNQRGTYLFSSDCMEATTADFKRRINTKTSIWQHHHGHFSAEFSSCRLQSQVITTICRLWFCYIIDAYGPLQFIYQ